MFDYLSSSAEARQANVDPEMGYYEFFRPLIQRSLDASNSQSHRIVQGGGGEGHPDFRIERRLPDSRTWRRSCLVEPKRHDRNLDNLETDINLQNRQIWRYLQQSDYVLITNFWQFRLLRRNDANEHQWPPVRIAEFSIVDSANEFWEIASNPTAEFAESRMRDLVQFLNENVINIPSGGTNSPSDLRESLYDLYRETVTRLSQYSTPEEIGSPEAAASSTVLQQITNYLPNIGADTSYQYAAQIHCLGMVLLKSVTGDENIDNERINHIRNNILRAQYSQIVSNRQILNLTNATDQLTNCLNSNSIDFTNFSTLESEFQRFLDITNPGWRRRYGYELTPPELVQYMVSLSDRRLREIEGFQTAGILRDSNTYRATIIDPCCGTGRFYFGVLRFIFDRTAGGRAAKHLAVARAVGISARGDNLPVRARVHAFDIQPACVLMTQLGLENFLTEIGMPEDICLRISPSIRLTDSLRGWTSDDTFGEYTDAVTTQIKSGQLNLLIGNPPWRGLESDFSPQDADRMETLISDWQIRSRQAVQDRGRIWKGPPLDPYVAFFRIAYEKSHSLTTQVNEHGNSHVWHDGNQMVTCFVSPQNYADSLQRTAMREDFCQHLDFTIDLLGGDYRRRWQGGNVFPINLSNCICTFRASPEPTEPTIRRRMHFGHDLTGEQKRASLLADCSDNALMEGFETTNPDPENWYKFYGGTSDLPAWPSIEEIRHTGTPALYEKRGWSLVSTSSTQLQNTINGIFTDSFELACQRVPLLWLGKENQDPIYTPTGGRRPWARFDAHDVWQSLQQYSDNHDSWFRQGTFTAFNHIQMFLPPPDVSGNLWNEPRNPAQRWGDVGGMICLAKEEVDPDTEIRTCFVPEVSINVDTIFRNSNSHPLFLRVNNQFQTCLEMEINSQISDALNVIQEEVIPSTFFSNLWAREEHMQLIDYPNLSEHFINWIQYSGYPTANTDLSSSVWFHILAILSSPDYNCEGFVDNPGGIELVIPIPSNPDQLEFSAGLGRQLAALQTPTETDTWDQEWLELEQLIDSLLDSLLIEPYSISGLQSSAAIIQEGVSLSTIHGSQGRIRFRGYDILESAPINPESLSDICQHLGLETELVLELLGNNCSSIRLSATTGLRNVPNGVLNMRIGCKDVLGLWLAWRCESNVPQQPIPNLWGDLRELLKNMIHMRLLFPQLDQNYANCSENTIQWP
jgi:hypothetical protein